MVFCFAEVFELRFSYLLAKNEYVIWAHARQIKIVNSGRDWGGERRGVKLSRRGEGMKAVLLTYWSIYKGMQAGRQYGMELVWRRSARRPQ